MSNLLSLILLLLGGMASPLSDWPGRPKADPPRLHQDGPPPAWIETRTRSTWLAYGSYCWTTLCVDMIPPAMRKDSPAVSVRRGNPVRLHFAFAPRSANVVFLRNDLSKTVRLPARQVVMWRPRVSGFVLVDVRGQRGSAGYLLRLRLLPAS